MNEHIKKLIELAGAENKEATSAGEALQKKITELDTKVTSEEKLKLDAIKSRDEAKEKLKDIANGVGASVDNVKEAIEAIKNKKAGNDDVKDKEIDALKAELVKANKEKEEMSARSKKEMLQVTLQKDIAGLLPKYNAKTSTRAVRHITAEVEASAEFVDGKVIFKNEDGTTKRIDGRDATVDDIIKEMQEQEKKENESMFFNIDVQNSGGAGSGKTSKVKDLELEKI